MLIIQTLKELFFIIYLLDFNDSDVRKMFYSVLYNIFFWHFILLENYNFYSVTQ